MEEAPPKLTQEYLIDQSEQGHPRSPLKKREKVEKLNSHLVSACSSKKNGLQTGKVNNAQCQASHRSWELLVELNAERGLQQTQMKRETQQPEMLEMCSFPRAR